MSGSSKGMVRVGESLTRAEMRWRAAQGEAAAHIPTEWEWVHEANQLGTFDELLAMGGIETPPIRPASRSTANGR